jgi:hypothetical protein
MSDNHYYSVKSEVGDVVWDPSEDALYMRISDLALPNNSFLTIEPPGKSGAWYVIVSLLEGDGYEIEYRDVRRHEHRVEQLRDLSTLCHDLIIWLRGALVLD